MRTLIPCRLAAILDSEHDAQIVRSIAEENCVSCDFFVSFENMLSASDLQNIDVLICDVRKMSSIDDCALINRMSGYRHTTRIILLSKTRGVSTVIQALRTHVDDFLLAPLKKETLEESLLRLMRQLNDDDGRCLAEAVMYRNAELIPQERFSGQTLCAAMIQLGNPRIHDKTFPEYSAQFLLRTEDLDIADKTLRLVLSSQGTHYFFQARNKNRYVLVLRLNAKQNNCRDMVEPFFRTLVALHGQKVSLVLSKPFVDLEVFIRFISQADYALNACTIAGVSQLLSIDALPEYPQALTSAEVRRIFVAVSKGNESHLAKELNEILVKFDRAPLATIQSSLNKIILVFQSATLIHTESSRQIQNEFSELLQSAISFEEIRPRVIERLLWLAQRTPIDVASSQALADTIELYITKNFNQQICMQEIAHRFHYSGAYITKVYQKYKHCSPIKHLIHLRISAARELLESRSDLSIGYIAEYVGYADLTYFGKLFKREIGMSPSAYREKHRALCQ